VGAIVPPAAKPPQARGRSGTGHQERRNATRSPRLTSTGEGSMWGAPPVEDPPGFGDGGTPRFVDGSGGTPRTGAASQDIDPLVYDGSWPQFLKRCTVGTVITCPGCNYTYPEESALWSHISSGKVKCRGPPKLVLEQWTLWYIRTFPSTKEARANAGAGKKRERDGNEPEGARFVAIEGINGELAWRREAGFFETENDPDSWRHIGWWDAVDDPGDHLEGYYQANPCVEFPANSRIRPQPSGPVRVNVGGASRQRAHRHAQ
jgi:hypothetical protein